VAAAAVAAAAVATRSAPPNLILTETDAADVIAFVDAQTTSGGG
jgi:hypothetical protein